MFDTCYPIVKGTLEEKAHSPVKIGVRTNERCPQCGCTLVNMMEIDGRDSRLRFLDIDGVIKAKCCPSCIIWSGGNYFSRYAIDGEGEIVFEEEPHNTEDCIKDSGIEEMDSNSYVLGKIPFRSDTRRTGTEIQRSAAFLLGLWNAISKTAPTVGNR